MKFLALTVLLCCSGLAFCQESAKTRVVFDCQCEDAVGHLYATAFRDVLATSPRYTQTALAESKKADGSALYSWHLQAISLDPEDGADAGHSTVLSLVILVGNDTFISHLVQTCGINVVTKCASQTLAYVDDAISSLR
jgi:hypothetical protein